MAPSKKHRTMARPASRPAPRQPLRRRNDDKIPDDVLLPLAPIAPPVAGTSMAMVPYGMSAMSRPRPSRSRRAATAVRRKAGELANALRPEAATITKDHLLGVGANAAGGIVTALAANEFVDNVGVMPMALSATVVGGLGSAFLKGNWQKVAQGVLGAGVGQLGTAYLTERALKKAAAAQKQAGAAAAGGKRNAYAGGTDDEALIRAMERTERRVNALLAEEDARNRVGDAVMDGANGGDVIDTYGYVAA